MDSSPVAETLEKKFQQVEEESARRAREQSSFAQYNQQLSKEVDTGSSMRPKERRRGSISISRFGQIPNTSTEKGLDGLPISGQISSLAAKSTFYQSQNANGSTSSFTSGTSHLEDREDLQHVTQMHQIVGRPTNPITKTVGSILPRRLSRAQSTHVMGGRSDRDPNLVIGISVEEATVDSPTDEREPSRATAYAHGNLRNRSSTPIMGASASTGSSWVMTKAKGFTQKFRRKSSKGRVATDDPAP